MQMSSEPLQILVSTEQRKRLEAQATRCGTSVAALVRDAVDRHLASVDREDRVRAVDQIRGMRGRFLPLKDLERLFEEERAGAASP